MACKSPSGPTQVISESATTVCLRDETLDKSLGKKKKKKWKREREHPKKH